MVPWLQSALDPLPPTSQALGPESDAPGLLAAGDDLSTARLEEAYRHGIFPWFSPGQPVLWWSPDPRMVLFTEAFKLNRSLRKTISRFLQTPGCEVRFDSAFDQVIRACAQTPRNGQDGTWIVPDMMAVYGHWHRLGKVHSVETWVNGDLVGGLYGVCIGRMFFGESMFSHRTDASKIALAALVAFCRAHHVPMIDCQQATHHLLSLGGREIPRTEFEARLTPRLGEPEILDWSYDAKYWATLHPALHAQALPT
jgi:leucyl/phenylalanyl-tRNA---protein transferase